MKKKKCKTFQKNNAKSAMENHKLPDSVNYSPLFFFLIRSITRAHTNHTILCEYQYSLKHYRHEPPSMDMPFGGKIILLHFLKNNKFTNCRKYE